MKIYYYLVIILITIYIFKIICTKLFGKIEKFEKKYFKDAHMIIDNLWLGNYHSSTNKDFFIKNNIKLVINCSRNLEFIDIPGVEKFRIDVHDDSSERTNVIMYKNLNGVINLIDNYLSNNQGVLIHCRAGMQRSAAIIAAYLMKKHKLRKDDAIKLIKSKRFIAFQPKANYGDLLSKYENELFN